MNLIKNAMTAVTVLAAVVTVASAQKAGAQDDNTIRRYYIKKQEAPPPAPTPAPTQQDSSGSGDEYNPKTFKIQHSLVTLIGFPRYFVGASYMPEQVGLKQTLHPAGGGPSQDITLSQFSLASAKVFGGIRLNEAMTISLDYGVTAFAIDSTAFNTYTVNKSTPTIQDIHLNGEYCIPMSSDIRKRWCPFVQLGVESFPAFEFDSSATSAYDLASITDMIVGVGVNYEFPLTPLMTGRATANYNQGLVTGQTGNTQLSSDYKFDLGFAADYAYNEAWTYIGGISFEDRTYKSTSVHGANTDKFDGSLTSFIFDFKVKRNF